LISPGDGLTVASSVANPTTQPVAGISVAVQVLLDGLQIETRTLAAGALAENESKTITFDVVAPFPGGTFTVTANASGFCVAQQPTPVSISSPGGGLVISELVLDPKQDWSDSAGGNGIPFDSVPGTGAIDTGDIWAEVLPTTGS